MAKPKALTRPMKPFSQADLRSLIISSTPMLGKNEINIAATLDELGQRAEFADVSFEKAGSALQACADNFQRQKLADALVAEAMNSKLFAAIGSKCRKLSTQIASLSGINVAMLQRAVLIHELSNGHAE